jgi:hypothetical protein
VKIGKLHGLRLPPTTLLDLDPETHNPHKGDVVEVIHEAQAPTSRCPP